MTRADRVKQIKRECERRFNVTWEDVVRPKTHLARFDPAKRWAAYHLYGMGLSFPRVGEIMNCHHSTVMYRVAMYQQLNNVEKLTTLKRDVPPSLQT